MNSPQKTIFITGASGFIGPLILRGLLYEDYKIITLLRNDGRGLEAKLKKNFQRAGIPNKYRGRITVISGDVSRKNLGMNQGTLSELKSNVSEVWHLAASLSFRRRDRDKNFSINFQGSKNASAFAKYVNAERFVYFSTVYIRGNRKGVVYEKRVKKPSRFTNSYEESKWEAENYILNSMAGDNRCVIIIRPSIVVGDNTYLPEEGFAYYNFLKSLSALREEIIHSPKILKLILRLIGLRVKNSKVYSFLPFPCVRGGSLNLIPARDLTKIALKILDFHRTRKNKGVFIYNVVDPNPVSLKTLFYETLNGLGLRVRIAYVPKFLVALFFKFIIFTSVLIPQLGRFARSLFYYERYILDEARYDTKNTQKIIGKEFASKTLLSPKKIRGVIKGFLEKTY